MTAVNYNREYERITGALEGRPRLLLHVCCAPCLSACIESLNRFFDVTLYYYNPNIYPESEYDKRLGEISKLLDGLDCDLDVIAERYDRAHYDNAVGENKGEAEHGVKCDKCCYDRLEKTAQKAKEGGYDYFCTTLTSSPLKDAEFLNKSMQSLAVAFGVKCLPSDFKKKGGNILIKETCEKYGIYRQKYCGCTPPRLVVAVTGGIASGKSTFTRMLGALGAYTIDADKITRELQAEGEKVNERIKQAFPLAITDGKLDRAKLKSVVFDDDSARNLLESIVHPAVEAEICKKLRSTDAQISVVEIPLLFESGMEQVADVTVNVTADYEERKLRAIKRDGMTADLFDSIASTQMSDDERAKRADVTVVARNEETLSLKAKELMREWQKRLEV
ncbi:MAG: dephospho-CoA kinase [Clostridia bacterium]|nr:dephospho-CoA kinase [Clostridia bacterium]